jgi:hypothetical protein
MKTILTTAVAALFAANVGAADIYHGLAEGNPDLANPHLSASDSLACSRASATASSVFMAWPMATRICLRLTAARAARALATRISTVVSRVPNCRSEGVGKRGD